MPTDESMRGDFPDQVSRLEDKIEDLAASIERCRKYDLVSKVILAGGLGVILSIALGMIRPEPLAIIGALAALTGGTVIFGSNAGTWTQATAEMKVAENLLHEVIGRADLKLVPDEMSAGERKSAEIPPLP